MNAERHVYKSYITTGFGETHDFSLIEYEMYYRFFLRNYDRYLPHTRDARILDLACGGGHFLYYLNRRGYTNYVGLDIAEECIEICSSKGLPAQKGDGFEYLTGKKRFFDVIVCNDFFEHLPKDRGFTLAKLCLNALRGGGKLILKVPNAACPLVGCRTRYVDITHEMGFTDHSLRTLLLSSGFTKVIIVGPDIYVTRNPIVNVAARTLYYVVTALFRALYCLYGVKTKHVMTKSLLAIAQR